MAALDGADEPLTTIQSSISPVSTESRLSASEPTCQCGYVGETGEAAMHGVLDEARAVSGSTKRSSGSVRNVHKRNSPTFWCRCSRRLHFLQQKIAFLQHSIALLQHNIALLMLFLATSRHLAHSLAPPQWLTAARRIATASANGTMAATAGEAADEAAGEAICSTAAVRIRREIWDVRNTRKLKCARCVRRSN